MSLALREEELKAESKIANRKNRNLIKDIVDPMPGLFIDGQIEFQQINQPNTADSNYKLKPQAHNNSTKFFLKMFSRHLSHNLHLHLLCKI